MSDKIGLFTGSFDPMTMGIWISLNGRADFFDKLYVGIFLNPPQTGDFSLLKIVNGGLEKALEHLENVEVVFSHDELVVDVAKKTGGYLSGTRLEKCNGFAI